MAKLPENQELSQPWFEISAMVYRDIALADAKAGFAITIAAVGSGAIAAFFGSLPDGESRKLILHSDPVVLAFAIGLLLNGCGFVMAIVTVLPRKGVRSEHLDRTPTTVENLHVHYLEDLDDVLWNNRPLPNEVVTDGGSDSLTSLISERRFSVGRLIDEVERQVAVRRRKYYWVGPSILFVGFGTLVLLFTLVIAVSVLNSKVKVDAGKVESSTCHPAANSAAGRATP